MSLSVSKIKMIDLFLLRNVSDKRILFTDWLDELGKQRNYYNFISIKYTWFEIL